MTDYWALNDPEVAVRPKVTFTARYVDNLVPLDDQFGIHPKRHWPTQMDPLFAPRVGHHLFVLLDAAEVEGLPDILADSGLPHSCLYQGDALQKLGPAAPWLVQMDPNSTFTRLLLTAGQSKRGLWDRLSGLYLLSDADLASVRNHLRKLIFVHDAEGKGYYLRFWEARFIEQLADRRDRAPEILHKLMYGRNAVLTALSARISRDRLVIIEPAETLTEPSLPAAFDLQMVMPAITAGAKKATVDAITEQLWTAMPQRFAALGSDFLGLGVLVERTMIDAADFGIRGRAAVGKLAALSIFTGYRPLHDPRLNRFRDLWLPVSAPQSDLASVTRMIEQIQGWRRAIGLDGDLSQYFHSVAQDRSPSIAAGSLSGLGEIARSQWAEILAAEVRRAGLSTHEVISAHALVATFCGPYFLQDPLQSRLAAVFASRANFRDGLAAEATLRSAGRIDDAV